MFTQSILIFLLAINWSADGYIEDTLAEINSKIDAILEIVSSCCATGPYASCLEIYTAHPDAQSGEYVLVVNGSEVTVYCEMGTSGVCGGEGGWTRIANIDITAGDDCPSGLFTSVRAGKELCDRDHTINGGACSETTFSTQGINYTKVCGRTRGYQYHGGGAIDGINNGVDDLESYYVDGVSITRGGRGNRQHVWTFANGNRQVSNPEGCPCNAGSSSPDTPAYVGDDYYCESATSVHLTNRLFIDDPLWDGQNCIDDEVPCCTNSNLPYFVRDFGTPSTQSIDYRICTSEGESDEAVGIDQIEIYIK